MDQFPFSACSAVQLFSSGGKPYLFRTCDLDRDVLANGAHPVVFSAGAVLPFSHGNASSRHAFMGISFSHDPHQLLDGINSRGLCGGLLLLHEGTSLPDAPDGKRGIMGMEFVAAMLAECTDTDEVAEASKNIRILHVPYENGSVPATMHYFFTDPRGKSIILEAADPFSSGKLTVYTDSVGVLTNSPPYPQQLDNLRWFLSQSPELRTADIAQLHLEGSVVSADASAEHLSQSGVFPASYAPYDRFIRAAVLKYLNDYSIPDEKMLPLGYNLMHPLFEPRTKGLFHYTRPDCMRERKNSFSQYVVQYDILRKELFIRPYDTLAWTHLCLEDLAAETRHFSLCRDSHHGICSAHTQS